MPLYFQGGFAMKMLVHAAGWILVTLSPAALAGLNNAVFVGIPSLDDVGLAILVGMVGALGGWLAGRRRK
jgi:hypothetical protein